jgi:hypothetical protein
MYLSKTLRNVCTVSAKEHLVKGVFLAAAATRGGSLDEFPR